MAITYHAGRRIQLLEADRTIRQGFDGGEGHGSGYTSGGGGGSSSVGVNATSTKAGDGGAGTQSDITGTATYYSAGGGGGIWGTGTTVGSGGSSIGGNGSSANNAGGNASGYGSGGGGAGVQSGAGAGVNQTGGNGSAGVVIIRYATADGTANTSGSVTSDTSTVSGQTILTYTGTGTFAPTSAFDVRYLVVGGGAGGGSSKAGFAGGGGGGAGGFRTATGHGVTAQTYNITVGSAGAGGVAGSGNGSNGNDSIFDTITSLGGGGGARGMNTSGSVGQNGASGGGAVPYFVTSFGTGTTTDVTPTNVQVGSRLEETDTRKMYSFTDTPTLSYDLSTSAGWTTTGSNCSVNTSGQYLEGSSSTNDDRATKALGLTLSDTKFVVRQKMQLTDVTTGGNGQLYFGYTDKDNSTTVLGNRDGIGITIRTGADFLHTYALNQAWQSAETLTTTPTETTYYLEIIRNSPTEMTMKLFDNANYSGTATETVTNTISSSINGLDHITIGGWDNNASGNITARFSDIEIYNNVSTVSGFTEWKEIGT